MFSGFLGKLLQTFFPFFQNVHFWACGIPKMGFTSEFFEIFDFDHPAQPILTIFWSSTQSVVEGTYKFMHVR